MHSRKSADQIAAQQFRLSLRTVAAIASIWAFEPGELQEAFQNAEFKGKEFIRPGPSLFQSFHTKRSGRAVGFANACEHNEL